MKSCKDRCSSFEFKEQYDTISYFKAKLYALGYKRCKTCGVMILTRKIFCPCCSHNLGWRPCCNRTKKRLRAANAD